MKCSSSNRSIQTGKSTPEKTRAQKDAHNASCRRSRQKIKRTRDDLEIKYSEMETNFQRAQDENKRMKLELNQKNSQIQYMEDEILGFKLMLQKQKEETEWMKHIPDQWKFKEGCYSSVEEMQEWVLSQRYDQVGQGSDYTSLNGSAAQAQASLLSNQNLPSASASSHVPIPDNSVLDFVDQSGVLSPTWTSIFANQNLSIQDLFSMIDDNNDIFTDNHATGNKSGFPAVSAARLPESSDLFTHHDPAPAVKHVEDFCSENNPSTKRN